MWTYGRLPVGTYFVVVSSDSSRVMYKGEDGPVFTRRIDLHGKVLFDLRYRPSIILSLTPVQIVNLRESFSQ